MSDIDFDELDKAVNSLVGDGDDKKESTDTSDTSDKPEANKEPNENNDTNDASSTLPSKRAGRFMDVKHTSSDMQAPNTLMSKGENNLSTPSGNIEEMQNEESKGNEKEDSGDKPSQEKESEIKSEENEVKEDETHKSEELEEKKDSPFIEDAKVEKRPLGGFSSDSPADSPKGGEGENISTPSETPPVVDLPPELDKDLVAIEAGESPESIKSAEDMDIEEDDSKDQDEKEDKKEEDTKDSEEKDSKDKGDGPKDHREKVAELLASASSGSIPEQYKRENRSHELQHDAHPLFDADHFKNSPSSVSNKPKSKKLVQWIFIYLGLILLGASLGAAVFVFVSQS